MPNSTAICVTPINFETERHRFTTRSQARTQEFAHEGAIYSRKGPRSPGGPLGDSGPSGYQGPLGDQEPSDDCMGQLGHQGSLG